MKLTAFIRLRQMDQRTERSQKVQLLYHLIRVLMFLLSRVLTNYDLSHRMLLIVASILWKYLKPFDMTFLITAVAGTIAVILILAIVDSVYKY
ncbi:hypothetical protein [uncultured Eudoraea sp.]|uniref:hypothetical protein n=1 Tax=uncultured Eudoraea sp. TaxID=1035614 RepID=UPI0026075A14|nr:hypothetical protein [uncultured Eudoraea sp.]